MSTLDITGTTGIKTLSIALGYADVRGYASFAAAIAELGSNSAVLLIPSAQTVSTNVTVPSNITLQFFQGGRLLINNGVTVTINGNILAGICQIFTCTGTGRAIINNDFIREVYPEWWGIDGVADDVQINAAIAALTYGRVRFVADQYNIAAKIVLAIPVELVGQGKGSFENSGIFTPATSLVWTGAANGTMLGTTNADSLSGVRIKDLCFNANNIAEICLDLKSITSSQLTRVMAYDYVSGGIGVKLTSLAGLNLMFNKFESVHCRSVRTSTQGIVMVDSATSNCCMNRFYDTRIDYIGNNPGIVVKGDNNTFFDTYIYRQSGTGYGIEVGSANPSSISNYFYHLQPGLGGLHITNNSLGNAVFGYDQCNGEPNPTVDSGSSLFCIQMAGINYINTITGLNGISMAYVPRYNISAAAPVSGGATSVDVVFSPAEPDDDYNIFALPGWETTCYVSARSNTGFTLTFGTAAPNPAGSTVTWMIIGKAP